MRSFPEHSLDVMSLRDISNVFVVVVVCIGIWYVSTVECCVPHKRYTMMVQFLLQVIRTLETRPSQKCKSVLRFGRVFVCVSPFGENKLKLNSDGDGTSNQKSMKMDSNKLFLCWEKNHSELLFNNHKQFYRIKMTNLAAIWFWAPETAYGDQSSNTIVPRRNSIGPKCALHKQKLCRVANAIYF